MPRTAEDHVMADIHITDSKRRRKTWNFKSQRHLLDVAPYPRPEQRISAHKRILIANAKYLIDEDKKSGKPRTFYYPYEKVYVGLKPGQAPPPTKHEYIATPPLSPQSQPKPLGADTVPSSPLSNVKTDKIPSAAKVKQALEDLSRKTAAGTSARKAQQSAFTEDVDDLPDYEDEQEVVNEASGGSNATTTAPPLSSFMSYSESPGFWSATQDKAEEPHIELPVLPDSRRSNVDTRTLDEDHSMSEACQTREPEVQQQQTKKEADAFLASLEAEIRTSPPAASFVPAPKSSFIPSTFTPAQAPSPAVFSVPAFSPSPAPPPPAFTPAQVVQPSPPLQQVPPPPPQAPSPAVFSVPAFSPSPAPPPPAFTPAQVVQPSPSLQQVPPPPQYTPMPQPPQPQIHVVENPMRNAYDIWARLAADVRAQVQTEAEMRTNVPPLFPNSTTFQAHSQPDVPLRSFAGSFPASAPISPHVAKTELPRNASVECPEYAEFEQRFRAGVEKYLISENERWCREFVLLGCRGRPIRPLPARAAGSAKEAHSFFSPVVRGTEEDLKIRVEWERELEQCRTGTGILRKKRRRDEDDSGYESASKSTSPSPSTPRSTFRMPTSDDDDDEEPDTPRPIKRVRFRDTLESVHFIPARSRSARASSRSASSSNQLDAARRKKREQRRKQSQQEKAKSEDAMRDTSEVRGKAGAQARLQEVSKLCGRVSTAVSAFFTSRVPSLWG